MSTKRATKRALLTSILAICLCLVMLVGSTFAWFTDTASTGVNQIQSGKLKIALEMSTDGGANWSNADKQVLNFLKADANGNKTATADILWEPGCTYELPLLRIRNDGNLALQYKVSVTSAQGDTKLLEAIDFTVKKGDATPTKLEGWSGILLPTGKMPIDAEKEDVGTSATIAISGHMREDAGNDYQDLNLTGIAITVNATQYTYEYDSTGNQYDAGAVAALPTMTATVDELNTIALDDLTTNESGNAVVEVPMGTVAASDIAYSENSSGYTGKGVMLGSTALNKYGAAPADAGKYTFIFKNGTIDSAATSYTSIDNFADSSVYMLVPGNSDVVFENMTFNGVVSFDIQMYTSPWSYLNSITFKNCTFNGAIIGSCPANSATFDNCTFNNYDNGNNSNPIWWRAATGYWGAGAETSVHSLQEFTFVNNTVTSTRPVKIERIGWNCTAQITIKNNSFDISAQAGDTETKNMAINIGQRDNTSKFVLVDEGNTISANTAALYTAALSSGSNQYIAVSGSKVLDGNGNPKTITAMVWKTTTGQTFEMKSVD